MKWLFAGLFLLVQAANAAVIAPGGGSGAGGSATNIFLISGTGINITTNSSGVWTVNTNGQTRGLTTSEGLQIQYSAATNFLPMVTLSAKGIKNSLSTLTNDGAMYGVDTPSTTTSGIQEALNLFTAPIGLGTNTTGACLFFGPGNFFFTNFISYSNNSVYHIRLQGASALSSRLIYAGNSAGTNILFFGRVNGGGGVAHVDLRDLTFSSITNANSILCMITNNAHANIENCNFTGWQVTTNTDWGAGVSLPDFPAVAQGGVGLVVGQSLEHATFMRNCYFAGLATGLQLNGDHAYLENIKFADIGMYGAGTEGTTWPNTSPYSLGAAILSVVGLSRDINNIHFYQCNGGYVNFVTGGGGARIINAQWETCDHSIACASPASSSFLFDSESSPNSGQGNGVGPANYWSVNVSPYSYGSSSAGIAVRYLLGSTIFSWIDGANQAATNFSLIKGSTIVATNNFISVNTAGSNQIGGHLIVLGNQTNYGVFHGAAGGSNVFGENVIINGNLTNNGTVIGVNQTNSGNIQAATLVATGAGLSVFNTGFSNNSFASFKLGLSNIIAAPSSLAGYDSWQRLTNVGALSGLAISTDAATLTTNWNHTQLTQVSASSGSGFAWTGSNLWTSYITYGTNLFSPSGTSLKPDLSLPFSTWTTNGAFTLAAPINVDTLKKAVQTCVIYVKNTGAAQALITPFANGKPVPKTGMYMTNTTRLTIEIVPTATVGTMETNIFATPID